MIKRVKEIEFSNMRIGKKYNPFIVAEMSANHNQSLERALLIVEEAAKCGVSAIKLQTFTADTITIDSDRNDFIINDTNSLWSGKNLYNLYQQAHMPWEWHKPLFDRCKEFGIFGFSTPFDANAVDFLETLKVPCYKIASFELVDIPLIKKVASTGKPLMISTGMATIDEIQEAVNVARANGCCDITLLKCTSTYPSDPKDSNLLTIPDMKQRFNCKVGLSDHTMGFAAAITSISLGASVIEKHFTLSRDDEGVDSAFSMEPREMKMLVDESKNAWLAMGKVSYSPSDNEKKSLIFRRSLYAIKDIKKGEPLTNENMKSIRPGFGLKPKYYHELLGRKSAHDITCGTPLTWDIID